MDNTVLYVYFCISKLDEHKTYFKFKENASLSHHFMASM